ncbi:MAG TPA: pitrilysin family protein [Gemmataceae bacterium]|nr:pitrilysin family protein [Gemmataceae bacterium]
MASRIYHHTLANGMTLLAEPMAHVRSAALNFLVPVGCIYDPPEYQGIASVLADLITRGAGPYDSRQLTLALDNLGLDRDESVGGVHMRFWAATLARNLPEALEIYAHILRRPHLPADEVDAVKALALQELQSLEDEPRQKVLIELRKRHYPAPLGQDRRGTREGIERLTIDIIRRHYQRLFRPRGTILAVAGNIKWGPLRDQVERLFGDWDGGEEPVVKLGEPAASGSHIPKDTTQTQIAIAFDSVPIGHPEYYAALGAVNVLSGGMSARLFTEVREKRGLCYAVWATYQTFKDRASVLCYAGTTNERAQETLDLILEELVRLKDGIAKEEVERVQAGLKSSLIMQEESTSARAGTLASDWYYLGRVRTFDEIQAAIDGLTPRKIVAHLRRHGPRRFTLVTLGPEPLRPSRRFAADTPVVVES